tara:strand:- start:278 stop:745 length:468 start_codon:yes stop_codon:yes gene_type:complete
LDICDARGKVITNLHLNKILFFIHVEFLREYSTPLVSAKLEAWDYGPVYREIYNQFKKNKNLPISNRAVKVSFDTGEKEVATCTLKNGDSEKIEELVLFYSDIPAGLLVDLSHETGGAWDVVWNHKSEFNIGMEITNEIISDYELNRARRVNTVQ